MPSNTKNGKNFSRRFNDECSPNATSFPRRIPQNHTTKPFPNILKDNDTTPGRIHTGRASVIDYTVWHFPEQITAIDARITADRAPACWVDKLGVKPPPGFERKEVKRKEVDIVPALSSPWDNMELAKLDWEITEKEKREARPRRDSGYASDEDLRFEMEKEAVKEGEREDAGVWESI